MWPVAQVRNSYQSISSPPSRVDMTQSWCGGASLEIGRAPYSTWNAARSDRQEWEKVRWGIEWTKVCWAGPLWATSRVCSRYEGKEEWLNYCGRRWSPITLQCCCEEGLIWVGSWAAYSSTKFPWSQSDRATLAQAQELCSRYPRVLQFPWQVVGSLSEGIGWAFCGGHYCTHF